MTQYASSMWFELVQTVGSAASGPLDLVQSTSYDWICWLMPWLC